VLQRQGVPALEVVDNGCHGDLGIDLRQSTDLGTPRPVVQGQTGDVPLDVGAKGKVFLGRRGGEISQFGRMEQCVVGQKDRAVAVGLALRVTATRPQRTSWALLCSVAIVSRVLC
jgi:hypothetical protein